MLPLSLVNALLATPLFQGMSRMDVQEIVAARRPLVATRAAGSVIARADSLCDRLIIVLSGAVTIIATSVPSRYQLTEHRAAPFVLPVEHLFGRRQQYAATYRAQVPSTLIVFSKRDMLALYDTYDVFRLNLLNGFVMRLAKARDRLWACAPLSLRQRIVQFLICRSTYPAGEKRLKITMNALAAELNTSRLNVSAALNSLAGEGYIALTRGEIFVPALEALYNIE